MAALTTYYQSGLLTVSEYDCHHPPGLHSDEEASHEDEFIFVLNGIYEKNSSDGHDMLDPSRIATFRKNQPYRITHRVAGGDRSMIVAFGTTDLCAAFGSEPDASGSALNRVPASLAVAAPLMLLSGRLRHGVHQEEQDALHIEESAYALLDSLSDAVRQVRRALPQKRIIKVCALETAAIVSSRFEDKLSIDSIAQMLDMSPFHLCRSFRVATGMTIHGYVTTLRMSEAVQRLWSYRRNLTELALDLGYTSHSHFSYTFRQFFGITPSELMACPAERLRQIERSLPRNAMPWH